MFFAMSIHLLAWTVCTNCKYMFNIFNVLRLELSKAQFISRHDEM
jgi:hypothetical protein